MEAYHARETEADGTVAGLRFTVVASWLPLCMVVGVERRETQQWLLPWVDGGSLSNANERGWCSNAVCSGTRLWAHMGTRLGNTTTLAWRRVVFYCANVAT